MKFTKTEEKAISLWVKKGMTNKIKTISIITEEGITKVDLGKLDKKIDRILNRFLNSRTITRGVA